MFMTTFFPSVLLSFCFFYYSSRKSEEKNNLIIYVKTVHCVMKMGDLIESIREELRIFENHLQNDLEEFHSKLNLTRKNFFDYINQQIEYLKRIKNDYNDEFNYLEEENIKTCQNNQKEFEKLCLSIKINDHDQIFVSKLFKQFKENFSMRPKMLKSIPQFHFKDISIDDFIIKEDCSITSTIDNNNSSSPIVNKTEYNQSFLPIDDTQISSLPTTSIGHSYHKQLASQ